MSDKKHIDRLFQEKFKDFEAQPSAKVWENIQNQLEQPTPKHKKAMPLWAKVASIAAILLLFISIGSIFTGNNDSTSPSVVNINDKKENTNIDAQKKELDSNKANNNLVNSNNTAENPEENSLFSSKNEGVVNNTTKKQNSSNSSNNATVTSQKTNTSNPYNSKKSTTNINEAVANTTNNNSSDKTGFNKLNNSTTTLEGIVNTTFNKTNGDNNSLKNTSQKTNNNTVYNNNYANSVKNLSQVSSSNETNQYNSVTTNSNNYTKNDINTTTDATAIALVNSLNEKEKENIAVALDYTKSNAIEEAIAKNQNINEKEKEEVDRWTVNANIAPVYYNTLGKGSHIHDQFIDNPKNGELNTSYGIHVGYAFNNRLKLRSGVSKLNLSYDTANVIVYETVTNTPGHNPLRNIDFIPNNQGETLSVLSTDNLGIQQISGIANDQLNAALSQRINYIEVPVELEYALVNKRFGVNIIGGLSTFILNGNEVVTEVDNRKTLIGKANNINNISFSTNLGIGIDYKFNDAFKFNLEPTFKYQINAYSEVSGDFKPYIIGVYTGFSYRF